MANTILKALDNSLMIEFASRDYEFNMASKHFHDEYEIYYLLEGERSYFINNQTYHVKKGNLIFVNSHEIHRTSTINEPFHERVLILFDKEIFQKHLHIFEKLNVEMFFEIGCGIIDLKNEEQKYVEGILFFIMKEIKNKQIGYEFLTLTKLAELLFFILRKQVQITSTLQHAPLQTQKHLKVNEVAHYISINYTSNESLDQLSDKFFISKYYLCRIFKEVTGFTVNEYININRIKQAQVLLEKSDSSITQIAASVGYKNTSHFNKIFKTYLETTPLQYRKNFLD